MSAPSTTLASASLRRAALVALVMLAAALFGAGCAPPPPPETPVVVVVPPSPPLTVAAKSAPEPDPPAFSEDAELRLINDRLRIVTPDGPDQTVELQTGGRVVKRVSADLYEEDFHLADVSVVVYEHESDWPNPHVARVKLKPGSITRWHRGEDEWTVSTILHVSFVFASKEAADDVVEAFRALAKH